MVNEVYCSKKLMTD